MKIGKTFVNSMVREVGRNYGKAISNKLLGDKHSTPYRRVGGSSASAAAYVAEQPAKKRMNELEKLINNFTRKTTERSTVTQALNIVDAYFSEADEAQRNGGAIDLGEAEFLVEKSFDVIRCISNSIEQLNVLDKTNNVALLEEKKQDVKDFIAEIDQAMRNSIEQMQSNHTESLDDSKAKSPITAGLLSLVGFGKAYALGFQNNFAKLELGVFLLVLLTITLAGENDISPLIVGGYYAYALLFSWRPVKKQEEVRKNHEIQRSNLIHIEKRINQISAEIARI